MSTGSHSVFRPAAVILAGRSLGFVAVFGMPIVLARVFPVSEFGTYKQVFLIYGTLLVIAQIGMAESLYYFLPANRDSGGRYAANTLAVLGLSGVVCLTLAWLARNGVGTLLNNPSLPRYLPLAGAFLAFSLGAVLLEITMTARKRFRLAAGTYAISEILRVGFFLVPVAVFGGLAALMWGAVAFAALRFLATLVYLRRHFHAGLRPDWHLLTRQLGYALPFALAVTIEVAQGTLHLYVVGHYFNPAEFAIYAVGCLQIPLVDLMMTSTGNVMMVRMQELRVSGNLADVVTLWRDTAVKMALVFAPFVAALLVVANPLITVLYTRKYAASVPVFMVSTCTILMAAVLTDSVLRVYAQTRYLVALNLVRLGVVAGTIISFMAWFGIVGAVVATVLATFVFKSLALVRIKYLLGTSMSRILPWGALGRTLLIAGGAGLPALVVKLFALESGLAPIIALMVAGLCYTTTYATLFWFFAPLGRVEKIALVRWLLGPLGKLVRLSGLLERRFPRRDVRP